MKHRLKGCTVRFAALERPQEGGRILYGLSRRGVLMVGSYEATVISHFLLYSVHFLDLIKLDM